MEAMMKSSPHLSGLISLSETTSALIDDETITSILATDSALPALLAHRSRSKRLLVITHSSRSASELATQLNSFTIEVSEFPAWETLPHERLSPNTDTVAKRIAALYQLKERRIVVAPVRAFVQPLISTLASIPLINLEIGQSFQFENLIRELSLRG